MNVQESAAIAAFAYRLRPLQLWGITGAWFLCTFVGIRTIPTSPPFPPTSEPLLMLMIVATLLGLGAAFVAGNDIDVAEPVARSMPRPYWMTVALRLGAWAGPSFLTVLWLTHRASGALKTSVGELLPVAAAHLALTFAVALAAARLFGSFLGGGGALATMTLLALFTYLRDDWPFRVFAHPASQAGDTSVELMFSLAFAIILVVLVAIAAAELRLLPHRR